MAGRITQMPSKSEYTKLQGMDDSRDEEEAMQCGPSLALSAAEEGQAPLVGGSPTKGGTPEERAITGTATKGGYDNDMAAFQIPDLAVRGRRFIFIVACLLSAWLLAGLIWPPPPPPHPASEAQHRLRPPCRPLVGMHASWWHWWQHSKELQPEQVMLALAGPLSMAVTWVTPSPEAVLASIVMYGTKSGEYSRTAEGISGTYEYTGLYLSGRIHRAVMGDGSNGLQPSTTYYYRVGDPSVRLSEEFSFTTLPEPGSDTPITFGVIGDLGQTGWSASTLAHLSETGSDLVIVPGDLSYADRYQPRWDSWGRLVQPWTSRWPWMFTVGNHEVETITMVERKAFRAYNARFRVPHAESNSSSNLWYSFDVAGVHVVMLAWGDERGETADFRPGSEQYDWLKADLAAVDRDRTPWVIALWHAPWYSSNTAHHKEGDAMMAAMEDQLFEHRVDLVLNGHVHAYERSARVYHRKLNRCGPVHIVIGDGGNREGLATEYFHPPPPWSLKREASFGHGTLEVVNATHARWRWHRNQDEARVVADEAWLRSLGGSGADECATHSTQHEDA